MNLRSKDELCGQPLSLTLQDRLDLLESLAQCLSGSDQKFNTSSLIDWYRDNFLQDIPMFPYRDIFSDGYILPEESGYFLEQTQGKVADKIRELIKLLKKPKRKKNVFEN